MNDRFFKGSFLLMAIVPFLFIQCSKENIRIEEKQLIASGIAQEPMRILTINEQTDSLFLRQKAVPISKKEILGGTVQHLKQRMQVSLTHPDIDGVGLAAPQVGIGIRMIAVQRFDKEGEPIEFYFNPKIIKYSETINAGREGCLSIPGYRANVERSQQIDLEYLDTFGKKQREKIEGFSAVIFQHEIDHLNGILYFDRVANGFESLEIIEE